jgi:hypothetical protein
MIAKAFISPIEENVFKKKGFMKKHIQILLMQWN